MTLDDKRKLAQTIFAGLAINGNRAGICVRRPEDGITELSYAVAF